MCCRRDDHADELDEAAEALDDALSSQTSSSLREFAEGRPVPRSRPGVRVVDGER